MPDSWDNTEAAAAALNDPSLSATDLAAIAYAQAALRPRVVGHPAAYPGLLDWLRGLGDPAVDAAFAQAASPTQVIAPVTGPTPVVPPVFEPTTVVPDTSGPTPVVPPVSGPTPVVPETSGPTPVVPPASGPTPVVPQAAAPTGDFSPTAPAPGTGPGPMATPPMAPGSFPTPGYPQPAAPYPPTGPNQWAGQYPTPTAGPPGGPTAPQAKPKKSRKGLLIGLIAAGVVIVLVVVGAVVVLPKLGRSSGGPYFVVPDFSAKPVAGQRINIPFDDVDMDTVSVWVGGSPVDGKAIALIEPVAPYSDEGGSDWYQGYDDDYADGFADGTAFVDEVDADYDYLSDYYDFDRADSQAGYSSGFDDAEYGFDYGYSAATSPTKSADLPPSLVQQFDLTTGELDWTFDVDGAAGTTVSYLSAPRFEIGGTKMAIAATLGDPGTYGGSESDGGGEQVLFAVDARDGTYKSRDFSSFMEIVTVVGDIVVVNNDETVSAYRLDDIDGAPVWEADGLVYDSDYDYHGIRFGVLGTRWVITNDGYVSIADGKPAGFGSDVGEDVGYYQAEDGAVYRFENFGSSSGYTDYEITKWDISADKPAWDRSVEVATDLGVGVSGGNLIAFDQDANRVIAYSTSTGKEVWSQRVSGQDSYYYSIVKAESWIAYGTPTSIIELLDSATGDERATIATSCEQTAYATLTASATALYVDCDGELTAWEVAGKDAGAERWSFKLRSGESISQLGGRLAVQTRNDDGSITLRLLAAK